MEALSMSKKEMSMYLLEYNIIWFSRLKQEVDHT
mgnify:CR=1 FL=1